MNKKTISWKEFRDLTKQLGSKLVERGKWSMVKSIYGIPRGGQYVALMLSELYDIPLTNKIDKNTLVVDDIADSGKTLTEYHGLGCGV
ncbi:hypothetical protein LCGC14_2019360, partial [marine sediment metagenome]